MAGLLNNGFGKMQALGAFGDVMANLSKGKRTDIRELIRGQMQNNPQQSPPLGQPNPHYTLPGNPIDQAAANLNMNPNLVPGSSIAPDRGNIDQLLQAIGNTESSGNYGILGKPTSRGDRAFGKYQVMGANIPSWSKEVLGSEMTPEQFLNNPQAQDAIAKAKLTGYFNKTGNIDDAASMWFSGRPMRGNNSRDILGTSVPEYVNRVRQQMTPRMDKFDTKLNKQEEAQFQDWKKKYAPRDSGADYDLRGAFKAGFKPDEKTGHWDDRFKKPNHPTFSTFSQYARFAPNKAGTWHGDTYIPNPNR